MSKMSNVRTLHFCAGVSMLLLAVAACSSDDTSSGTPDAGSLPKVDAGADATSHPPVPDAGAWDGAAADATTADASTTDDAGADADTTADSSTESDAEPTDEASAPVTCAVHFHVDGANVADAGGESVYVVGELPVLGNWNPSGAVAMDEDAPGAGKWTGAVTLTEGTRVRFKFIKRAGDKTSWEDWGLYSNRNLIVKCGSVGGGADAGSDAADAAVDGSLVDASDAAADASVDDAGDAASDVDAGTGAPAVGDSYYGTFNVKPADASKD